MTSDSCPCGEGIIKVDNPNLPTQQWQPTIECEWCAEVYQLTLQLAWNSWEGTYRYWWKPTLRS